MVINNVNASLRCTNNTKLVLQMHITNYVCAFDDIPVSHGVLAFRRGLISKNKIFTVWIMKAYLFSESLQEWVT